MLSFRKKILLSDIALFLIFICLLFPFVEKTVIKIMRSSLEHKAGLLINRLLTAPDFDGMIALIQEEETFAFQRITLIDLDHKTLFDSHPAQLKEDEMPFEQYEKRHPEIEEALVRGHGYQEYYAPSLQETFGYVAKVFELHGQKYILRVGFPLNEIRELTFDFEVGFLALGVIILLLYTIMTSVIIHRLTEPIQEVIDAIRPYQQGQVEYLPKVELREAMRNDEFSKLAQTLNQLTEKIQRQIQYLKQQKIESEGILESLSEGIIAFDPSGTVTFVNGAAVQMLGIERDMLIGQKRLEKEAQDGHLFYKCLELAIHTLQTSETVIDKWSKEKRHLSLTSAPLAQQNGAIVVLQDRTSDYKVLEIGKDFVANASHELRTPITIIRGFAETLQDLPHLSQEMLAEITQKIVRTCVRLDNLVKSLLTLSDIENLASDKLHLCDLVALAENCKHLLLTAHPQAQVTIETELSKAIVLADANLLDLALMNLLENAVKYCSTTPEIKIQIRQIQGQYYLSVQDNGIGIPDTELPHIFGRFYTVDKARSRKSGGAGLGLSIVKTIIEKHKGTIFATSEIGQGTTFTMVLPFGRNLSP
ncbi:MAG: hypothetical protein RL235_874 [Chlamydiota bacterium]